MPPGYPKGQAAYTTAKVIVARAFQPPFPKAQYSDLPLDPERSEHGTHVAGIAAGNPGTTANIGGGRVTISGVAPRACLGNYRVLSTPTISGVGLNGNSPEIAAGIEAAVRDGMDVINLSLGEPEIAPERDLVVRAIEGAAAAGVVSAIAAGNDFGLYGTGSIASPGSARSAITAAAASVDRRIAGFGAGPLRSHSSSSLTSQHRGRDPLLGSRARRNLGGVLGHEHGDAARCRRGGAVDPAAPNPDRRAAQVLFDAHRAGGRGWHLPGGAHDRQGAGFIDVAKADQPLVFAQPPASRSASSTEGEPRRARSR